MENFKKIPPSIKNWAEDERPREKMLKHGSSVLSNAELLAIIINTGSGTSSAVALAKEILQLGQNNLDELGKLSANDLQKNQRHWRSQSRCYIGHTGIGAQKTNITATRKVIGKKQQGGC